MRVSLWRLVVLTLLPKPCVFKLHMTAPGLWNSSSIRRGIQDLKQLDLKEVKATITQPDNGVSNVFVSMSFQRARGKRGSKKTRPCC